MVELKENIILEKNKEIFKNNYSFTPVASTSVLEKVGFRVVYSNNYQNIEVYDLQTGEKMILESSDECHIIFKSESGRKIILFKDGNAFFTLTDNVSVYVDSKSKDKEETEYSFEIILCDNPVASVASFELKGAVYGTGDEVGYLQLTTGKSRKKKVSVHQNINGLVGHFSENPYNEQYGNNIFIDGYKCDVEWINQFFYGAIQGMKLTEGIEKYAEDIDQIIKFLAICVDDFTRNLAVVYSYRLAKYEEKLRRDKAIAISISYRLLANILANMDKELNAIARERSKSESIKKPAFKACDGTLFATKEEASEYDIAYKRILKELTGASILGSGRRRSGK